MQGYGWLVVHSSHFVAIDCSPYKVRLAYRYTWSSRATGRRGSVCVAALPRLHQSHSATLNDRIILLLLVDWEVSPMITSARCVLVCVCGYIYRCVCMCVCVHVCACACMCVHVYEHVHVSALSLLICYLLLCN